MKGRLALAVVTSLFVALPSNAVAATFTVNSTDDLPDARVGDGRCNANAPVLRRAPQLGSKCTLRAAIQEANADGASTIQLPAGVFTTSQPLPAVTVDLKIAGAGEQRTTIRGSVSGGTLNVSDLTVEAATGTGVTVTNGTLTRVRVVGATQTGDWVGIRAVNLVLQESIVDGGPSHGLGVWTGNNVGSVSIQSSTIKGVGIGASVVGDVELDDSVLQGASSGTVEGLSASATSKVVVNRATVTGFQTGIRLMQHGMGAPTALIEKTNVSNTKLGISEYALHGGSTIVQSTISGNTGGILNEMTPLTVENTTVSGNNGFGVLHNPGNTTPMLALDHDTIASNRAMATQQAPIGGGLVNEGDATVANSIIAGGVGADCADTKPPTSLGHNILGSGCAFAGPTDRTVDPMLGPLGDNGGPTLTQALLPGSPAIDAASSAGCPATDQRGVARPAGAGCDIGAFEFSSASDVTVKLDATPPAARVGDAITYTGTVTNKGPDAATLVKFTDVVPPGLSLVSATSSQGVCVVAGATVTCAIGSLADHASTKVTLVAKAQQAGTIVNKATVKAGQIDPDTASNSAQATVVVSAVTVARAGFTAQLLRARVTRRNHRYQVQAILKVNERASARVVVSRRTRALAVRTVSLRGGSATVRVLLPRKTKKGALVLRISLKDTLGASVVLHVRLRAR